MAEQLRTQDKGLWEYKDSKGQECYFYFFSIGDNTDLDILGYIPVEKIESDGIGMSEKFQQTMYSTFSRATDSRINKIQGSGLGLAIVKQMVELMGGTIQCDSALGKGTTFVVWVNLPAAEEIEKKMVTERTEENPKDAQLAEKKFMLRILLARAKSRQATLFYA